MTLKTFYQKLADLTKSGKVRAIKDGACLRFTRSTGTVREFCPLTAVYWFETGTQVVSSNFPAAARGLGIDAAEGCIIANAADSSLKRIRSCGELGRAQVRRRMAMKRAMNINGGTK